METQLEIVYEDDFIIAINKPAGLLVHRSKIARDVKEFALQILRDQVGYHVTPIHRLDRKTSGVLLFAKNQEFVHPFQLALQNENTQKRYLAIVRGYFPDEILVDHLLINESGKKQEAVTKFRLLKQVEIPLPFGKFDTSRYSLIEALPKTGRMHQIRKHLNHLRHPIIGDRPHGCNKQNALFLKEFGLEKMLLHAESLKIMHPFLEEELVIEAGLPGHFLEMSNQLQIVGFNRGGRGGFAKGAEKRKKRIMQRFAEGQSAALSLSNMIRREERKLEVGAPVALEDFTRRFIEVFHRDAWRREGKERKNYAEIRGEAERCIELVEYDSQRKINLMVNCKR